MPQAQVQRLVAQSKQIDSTLTKTGKSAMAVSDSFKSLAGAFTGMWAGRLVAGALKSITRPAIEMQTAMARLAVLADESGMGLEQFKKKAMEVAGITTYGPVEMTNALMRLRQVTGDTNAALGILRPTAQLAMASFGKIKLDQAVEMMGFLVKGFGMTADQAVVGAQRIFTASKALGVGIESYQKVMDRLATAHTMGGQSFDEMIKIFGLLSREMGSAREASTGLTRSMQMLGTGKAQDVLRSRGIIATGKAGGLLPMHEIIGEISRRMEKDTAGMTERINKAFGMKASRTIFALIHQFQMLGGDKGWAGLSSKMMKDTKALENASRKWLESYEGQSELLNESLSNLAITVGEKLLPALTSLATQTRQMIEGVHWAMKETWIGAIIGPAAKIALTVAGLWAMTAAFGGLWRILLAVTGNMATAGATWKMFLSPGMLTTSAAGISGLGSAISTLGLAIAGLATKLFVLAWAFYAFKAAWNAAKRLEKKEVYSNIMARKIIQSKGTTPEEKEEARRVLQGGITAMPSTVSYYRLLSGKRGGPLTGLGRTLGVGKVDSPAMVKITAEMADKYKQAVVDPTSEVESTYDRIVNKMAKAGELSVKHAEDAYGHMVMGSDKMLAASKELLSKRHGLTSYVPPLVRMAAFRAMKQQLTTAMGAAKDPGQRMGFETALREAAVAEALIKKSQDDPLGLNPTELMQLKTALAAMGVAGSYAWRQYGPGIMSQSMLKRFDEQVGRQVGEMGSERNQAWTGMWAAMTGGQLGRGRLPGFNTATGGYGRTAAETAPFFAGTLPGQQSRAALGGGMRVKLKTTGPRELEYEKFPQSSLVPGGWKPGSLSFMKEILPTSMTDTVTTLSRQLRGLPPPGAEAPPALSPPMEFAGTTLGPGLQSMLPPAGMLPAGFVEVMTEAFKNAAMGAVGEINKKLVNEFKQSLGQTLKVEVVGDRRDPMGPTGGAAGQS
jgi:TP901 family phage tail tape measure protein